MAHDVQRAIVEIIVEQGEMDEAAAEAHLKKMKRSMRYLEDIWS